MLKGIKKYYIGLSILALFVAVLLIYVLSQADIYKKDKQLNARAVEISQELNAYISSNNSIPENLTDAVSGDMPEEIIYTKKDKRYTFCVSYRSSSDGITSPQEVLLSGVYGSYSVGNYDYSNGYVPSTLYINSTSWSKGEQCQTVEPYLYSSSIYDQNNPGTLESMNYVCETDYEYYSVYKDSCVNGEYKLSYSN